MSTRWKAALVGLVMAAALPLGAQTLDGCQKSCDRDAADCTATCKDYPPGVQKQCLDRCQTLQRECRARCEQTNPPAKPGGQGK